MVHLGAVADALSHVVRNGSGDAGAAAQICRAFADGLDVDGAALLSLNGSGFWHTLAATDPTAEWLQDQAFGLNQGPCLAAARSGAPVLVADLCDGTEAARWPMFASAVVEHSDVRALFSLPLHWGPSNLGVMELYRVKPGMLIDQQLRDAISGAESASLIMLGLRADPGDRYGWLEPVVAHRAEIHQASGMVSVQLDITPAEALLRMRARAFAESQPLLELARDVVARRVVFAEDTDR